MIYMYACDFSKIICGKNYVSNFRLSSALDSSSESVTLFVQWEKLPTSLVKF